jgi:pimeloyl-ACP methyl ester carboxylesterase
MPSARTLLCRLERVHHEPHAVRSPVLFIHGFPDSPAMYAAYHTPTERAQPWLRGRSIYTLAFPNRQSRPEPLPSLADLRNGRLQREFHALVQAVIAAGPTGKLVIVAHDWGATYTWALVRSRPDLPLEALVSLSVGSSFRYDLGEHGLRALAWLYNIIFGMPYYLPTAQVHSVLDQAMEQAGYESPTRHETYRDSYHYWDWPQRLALLGPRLFGWGAQPAFTDIRFPVLFMRSAMDRIATTAGFETHLRQQANSRVLVFDGVNHWFPEQHAERVLTEIRRFAALQTGL